MKWWKYKTIYATGSSLTAGGGMNDNQNKQEYKRLYDFNIFNEKDFTYPTYIAKHFNCKLVHDAQSGAGAPRLIRRTYNYIRKVGLEEAKKTLFLFEITDPIHRVDFYIEDINDYVIVNVRYDDNDTGKISSIQIQETTTDLGVHYSASDLKKYESNILEFLTKYHNPITYTKKFIGEIGGLFSFLEQNDFDYFFQFDSDTLTSDYYYLFNKLEKKELKIDGYKSINQFTGFQNMTVKDDLKGFTSDLHPGYFGHKLFAEKAIKLIEERLKPKLFVFGDSHTQSFNSHLDANSSWAVDYVKYLGYCPKNYVDLLSEHFDFQTLNHGMGGCSNQTIFDKFLDFVHMIEPKDIIIFGWTSEGRFRIANEVNAFVDTIPFNPHPPQNDDLPKDVTNLISLNKVTYNVWWKEIIRYIEIAKKLLPKNKNILSWTWVDDKTIYPERLWSKEMIDDNRLCLYVTNWSKIDTQLKNIIEKESDLFVDFSEKVNYDELINHLDKGKRVTIINGENMFLENRDFFTKKGLRTKVFDTHNYKSECYKLFIPYRKYLHIKDETKDNVNDLHTSELGHRELCKDFINNIKL